MRSVFQYLLISLVLAAVFLAAALTAMRFAIHGREVSVPNLTGMKRADAERALADLGLHFSVDNRFYSPQVPAGRILAQQPPAGEKVRVGWRVRAAESLGPQRVSVPNVVGQSARAAEIDLKRRGLQVASTLAVHLPDAQPDVVIAQSPTPESTGATSPVVSLLVGAPPAPEQQALVMPDLLGQTVERAATIIAGAGLKFGKVTTASNTNGKTALVLRQSPAAGHKVLPGAVVNLDVVRQ